MGVLLFLLFCVIATIIIMVITSYNRLQSYMQSVREAYSNLKAALQKRFDLSAQIIDISTALLNGLGLLLHRSQNLERNVMHTIDQCADLSHCSAGIPGAVADF